MPLPRTAARVALSSKYLRGAHFRGGSGGFAVRWVARSAVAGFWDDIFVDVRASRTGPLTRHRHGAIARDQRDGSLDAKQDRGATAW